MGNKPVSVRLYRLLLCAHGRCRKEEALFAARPYMICMTKKMCKSGAFPLHGLPHNKYYVVYAISDGKGGIV